MKIKFLSLLTLLSLTMNGWAQENRLGNQPVGSSEIYHKIEKLGFLGSALFIAAHPDDENTRLISWLDNAKMARTAYLSITRGDGGQNLIGAELREQLGMIRTQELLEARNIDGGEQFFTRANDFGYSKDPQETLEIWNKEQVLSDVVQIIRKFQPDIIINRFDHRTAGETHGHHTSSALLSVEAFDLVADKNAYPAQLKYVNTWKPERLFFNTSWWFYGSEDAFAKADKTNLLELETGNYFNYSGYSNGEIAALSRSQHQSQGFGSSASRGEATEYLEFLKGNFPTDKSDPFSGINTTWTRVSNGEKVLTIWNKVKASYDFKSPASSFKALLQLRSQIMQLEDGYWKNVKLAEVEEIIKDVMGLYAKAYVSQPYATAGESLRLHLELSNRALEQVQYEVAGSSEISFKNPKGTLSENTSTTLQGSLKIPADQKASNPYYLEQEPTLGMYKVADPKLIGMPEDEATFHVPVTLKIEGEQIQLSLPVIYKTTDRVRGEVYEPFHVVPAVTVQVANPVYIFQNGKSQDLKIQLTAFEEVKDAVLKFELGDGWSASPQQLTIPEITAGTTMDVSVKITPAANNPETQLMPYLEFNGKRFDQQVYRINYNHIPDQQLVQAATAKLVNPGLQNLAESVAYINGAGDDVAQAIEAMGSKVFKFEPSELPADLVKYDAIVVGIRAFNVAPEAMANLQSRLDSYVQNGGTLIMQYNTDRGIPNDALGPLPISLSRKRVTDENAAVVFLNPENKALNTPNKITQKDFEGWVQERGLYFPEDWDPAFEPVLGMNDADETQTTGSLLVAPYGKGHVVYTGLSFFRELPAGVTGAYRLMANLLSLSKTQTNLEGKKDTKF